MLKQNVILSSEDPFENPPYKSMPNCDAEYRFKFEVAINSIDEFIAFLKNHQFKGALVDYKPVENKLIPSHTASENLEINLDKLKTKVKVVDIPSSSLLNKRIYTLYINNGDFKTGWHWQIAIKMSDKGYVSVYYCAGI